MQKKILVFGFRICLILGVLVMLIQGMKYSYRQRIEIERRISKIEGQIEMLSVAADEIATRIENLERESYGSEYMERMQEARRVAQMHEMFDSLESQKRISLEEFLGKSNTEEENPFFAVVLNEKPCVS